MTKSITEKKCTKCGIAQNIAEFPIVMKKYTSSWCLSCKRRINNEYNAKRKEIKREYDKKYRKATVQRDKERHHKYYLEHVEEIKNRTALWQKSHPEKTKRYREIYRKKYPDSILERTRNRRARRNYIEGKITRTEWKELLVKYNNKCLCCGRNDVKLELDHVVPLALGGKHNIHNAQPLCRTCNAKKYIKIIDYR